MIIGPTSMAVGPGQILSNPMPPSNGEFTVRFLDVDGEILLQRSVNSGWSVSPPTSPTRTGLTFVGWSEAAILVTRDMDIVANYSADDGKAHVLIEASSLVGLTPTLKLNKSDTSTLLVEWGDGTTSTTSESGNVTIVKDAAYAPGSYDIKKSITVGTGTFTGGYGTPGNPMIAGVAVTEVWYRQETTSISVYALSGVAFRTMRVVLGGNNITNIGSNAIQNGYALITASFPLATSIGSYAIQNGHALIAASFPAAANIGNNAIQNGYASITASLPAAANIGGYAYASCPALITAWLPAAANIGSSAFQFCRNLREVLIGPGCTFIDLLAFDGCRLLRKLTMQAPTPPTLAATTVFGDYDPRFMIEVPASSLVAYQAATNWSAYADRMVGV